MLWRGVDTAEARAPLDRTTIVEAALALLDEVGLDDLSTRRLAARLGVKGPSLYWHVKGMGELRTLMADVLLASALPAPNAPGDWRTWLADGARGYRRAALSRRDGARLLAGARPTEARRASRFPANIARLQAAGFSENDARACFMVLARFAMGWALGEQAGRGPSATSQADFEFGLAAMLDGLETRARRG
jgi:TetR/AcrR family tetracycline transcriptional repressor